MKRALVHSPLRPARTDHPEADFLAAWREHIASDDEAAERIFGRLPFRFGQRAARVAASFVTWLGTNCGACFLHEAQRLMPNIGCASDAYLAAWAHENRRLTWLNSGIRTMEWMLAPEPMNKTLYPFELRREVFAAAHNSITQADHDVIEALLFWLAEQEGAQFVRAATARVKAAHEGARLRRIARAEVA